MSKQNLTEVEGQRESARAECFKCPECGRALRPRWKCAGCSHVFETGPVEMGESPQIFKLGE